MHETFWPTLPASLFLLYYFSITSGAGLYSCLHLSYYMVSWPLSEAVERGQERQEQPLLCIPFSSWLTVQGPCKRKKWKCHAEVHCRQGTLQTLGNISELPSSALVRARKNKGPARIPKSFHPSKTSVPPSVLVMYVQLGQLGTGNCLSTDTLMFPGQWHVNMEISKAQGLKAHQCSSLKSHCCELLLHPREVPTALPKWSLSSPNDLCHPLEFSSGSACPCLYSQTSLLLLLQRCISWYNRSWPDKIPAFLFSSAPSLVNVFTCVIPPTFYNGSSSC